MWLRLEHTAWLKVLSVMTCLVLGEAAVLTFQRGQSWVTVGPQSCGQGPQCWILLRALRWPWTSSNAFWNPARPYLLIYVPAWYCFTDFLLRGAHRLSSPTWNGVGAAWGYRDRRVWRSKAAVAEERKKANGERQMVGWTWHCLQRDMGNPDLASGSPEVSTPVNLRSGELGESPSCCQMSLGEVRPLRLPAIQTKL